MFFKKYFLNLSEITLFFFPFLVLCGLGFFESAHADAPVAAAAASMDLVQNNPFDPQRKSWPDVVPPPPIQPPIPAPAVVTDVDLQVYGVVLAGSVRKAVLKLGPRFAGVPVGASGFASVSQGGQLGEFVLAEVQSDQVLLRAAGGEQWVRFSVKKDRSARGVPASVAVASQPMVSMAPVAPSMAVAPVAAFPGVSVGGSAAVGMPNTGGVPLVDGGGVASAQSAQSNVPVAPPGSLAAAIAAAQAAQGGNRAGAAAPTGAQPMNPFEALLRQQQAR